MEVSSYPEKLFEEIWKNRSGSVVFHYVVIKSEAGDNVSSNIRFERNGDIEAGMRY